ncbi:MAG: hypothetical protein Q4G42_04145 [Neisseria sp.]|nr:hypothetical protein [Neisseria sp.]
MFETAAVILSVLIVFFPAFHLLLRHRVLRSIGSWLKKHPLGMGAVLLLLYPVLATLYVLIATSAQGNSFDTDITLVRARYQTYLYGYLFIVGTVLLMVFAFNSQPKAESTLQKILIAWALGGMIALYAGWALYYLTASTELGSTYRSLWLGKLADVLWNWWIYPDVVGIRGQMGDIRRSLSMPALGFSAGLTSLPALWGFWLFWRVLLFFYPKPNHPSDLSKG